MSYEVSQDIAQKWGTYAPETQKVLLELEQLHMTATAKRLATAIDREYVRRVKTGGPFITYTCKDCGKEFRREKWTPRSKEYCNKCQSKQLALARPAILTRIYKLRWEEVDEIRNLHATTRLTNYALAEKYGVSTGCISAIVNFRTYKPEDDPRRGEVQP